MLVFSLPSQQLVEQTVQVSMFVQELKHDEKKGAQLPDLFLPVVSLLNAIYTQALKDLGNVSEVEAKELLKMLRPVIVFFSDSTKDGLNLNETVTYTAKYKLYYELIENIRLFIGELIYIADGRTIDENSPHYVTFLYQLIHKYPSNKTIVGKDKLFALFN